MDRRKFLTYVGCTCCSLALNSCATAPITDRKQLKLIPEAKLNAQAAQIFEKIKEKEKLITGPKLNQIKEIGKKMENSIGEYFYLMLVVAVVVLPSILVLQHLLLKEDN